MLMYKEKLFWLILLHYYSLINGKTCTPSSARNSSIDDVPAISKALSLCGNGGTIIISAGEIFMIRSPLDFKECFHCFVQIEGILKISDDLQYWEGKTAFLLLSNVIRGTFHSLTGSGLIDGNGQSYWDYFARNQTYQRPLLIQMNNSSNIIFTKLKIINSPFWFFFVTNNSTNIEFSDLSLSAISTSSNRPANTDGFDTGDCSYVTIKNLHVTNGDDCISFKNGSNYIFVNNITCNGSHGLSVGSLGLESQRNYIVQNIFISNVTMINSIFATRIKFYPGVSSYGTVSVKNVTYENIIIDNCDYALQVDNCYETDPMICKKYPSTAQLVDIKFKDLIGKTSKRYDPVVARIDCPPSGICNLMFTNWNIVAPSGNSTVRCSYYEHPSGITCTPYEQNL